MNKVANIKKRLLTVSAIAMLCACGGSTFFESNDVGFSETALLKANHYATPEYSTITGHYLSATMARQNGNARQALDYLNEAIGLGETNKDLYIDAYSLALGAGDVELAGHFATKIENTNDNVILSPSLVQSVVALKAADYVKAEKLLQKAPEQGFGTIVVSLLKAWVSQAQNKPIELEALKAMQESGAEFELLMQYQLAILLEAMGEDADEYYKNLVEAPYLPHHMAIRVATYLKKNGDKTQLANLQKRYDGNIGLQLLSAANAGSNTLTPQEGAAEVFYGVASLLVSIDALQVASVPLQMANYLNEDFTSVHFIQAQIAEKSGDSEKAISLYKKLENDEAYGLMSSLQLAYLYQSQGKQKKTLGKLDKLLEFHPNNLNIWLAKGDIYRSEEQFDNAVNAYTKAIGTIENKMAEHWPAFYSRAISYERAGNWQKAEADFLEALRLQPDQPDVLNYLGYSWLIQNRQLNQAKAMIEKAMRARPRDAHIIDSMGWALYRLGEYEKALVYLERAVNLSPLDATVNEHLGDVYWRMGYEVQARYQWERALAFNPTEPGQAKGLEGKITAGLPAADVPKTDVMQAEVESYSNDEQRAEIHPKEEKTAR